MVLCWTFGFHFLLLIYRVCFLKVMKWSVILAREREITVNADNINVVVAKANAELKEGERIVSIRIKR